MNCPICNTIKVRKRSKVAWGIPWKSHKDKNGQLHKHNPNKHFVDYKCQRGHVFEKTFFLKCLCGWQATNE